MKDIITDFRWGTSVSITWAELFVKVVILTARLNESSRPLFFKIQKGTQLFHRNVTWVVFAAVGLAATTDVEVAWLSVARRVAIFTKASRNNSFRIAEILLGGTEIVHKKFRVVTRDIAPSNVIVKATTSFSREHPGHLALGLAFS